LYLIPQIPDNGYCLIVQGPHVGITQDGLVGKVEREGIALVDSCCGSAIAASNYLKGITQVSKVLTIVGSILYWTVSHCHIGYD